MSVWVIVASVVVAWALLSVVVALAVGATIRLRDRRERPSKLGDPGPTDAVVHDHRSGRRII